MNMTSEDKAAIIKLSIIVAGIVFLWTLCAGYNLYEMWVKPNNKGK